MPTINETTDDKFSNPEAARALASHLNCRWTEIEECAWKHYGNMDVFTAEGGEYAVGTDEEADAAWDEALDSYIDECIMTELREPLSNYFDRKAWKCDARMDGRGHALSSYDGNEYDADDPISGWNYIIFQLGG